MTHFQRNAFIFERNNTDDSWDTTAVVPLDQNTDVSSFGYIVAMTNNWIVVGSGANKAFIFKNDGGIWDTTAAFVLDQNSGDYNFGQDVAVTDNWAIVGTYAQKAYIFKN